MTELDDLDRLCRAARRSEDPCAEDFGAVQRGVARQLGLAAALGATATSKVGSALGAPSATVGVGAAAKVSLASVVVAWLVGGAALGGVTSWLLASQLSPQLAPKVAPREKKPAANLGLGRSPERAIVAPPSATFQDAQPQSAGAPGDAGAPVSDRTRTGPRARALAEPAVRTSSNRQDRQDHQNLPKSVGLVDEARALAEVQLALRDGQAERALALLSEMDARFGRGALGAERMAAQVLALCGGGRVEQGRALSERFSGVYPNSPLLQRILAACAR